MAEDGGGVSRFCRINIVGYSAHTTQPEPSSHVNNFTLYGWSVLRKFRMCHYYTRAAPCVRHSLDERNAKKHKTFSCFSFVGAMISHFTQSLQNQLSCSLSLSSAPTSSSGRALIIAERREATTMRDDVKPVLCCWVCFCVHGARKKGREEEEWRREK